MAKSKLRILYGEGDEDERTHEDREEEAVRLDPALPHVRQARVVRDELTRGRLPSGDGPGARVGS